jgi:hypothetical protein
VRIYALATTVTPDETLDLYLRRDEAEAELRKILGDEPDWIDVLSVVPIDLDERATSQN